MTQAQYKKRWLNRFAPRFAPNRMRPSDQRHKYLLRLTDAVRPLSDPLRVQQLACEMLANQLGVPRVCFHSFEPQSHIGTIRYDYAGDGSPSLRGFKVDWPEFHAALSEDREFIVRNAGNDPDLSDKGRGAMRALGLSAMAGVGIVKMNTLVGSLYAGSPASRRWSPLDLELIRDTAERTWVNVERIRAQEELRRSDERFRNFAEASSDALWIRSAETMEFEFLSAAFETVFGTTGAKSANSAPSWCSIVHEEDLPAVRQGLERVRKGEHLTQEYRIRHPQDGCLRWIRDTSFPLKDDSGEVSRIGGIARDVTLEKDTAGRLQVLVAELQHRTRNLIAVVSALCERTLNDHPDVETFRYVYGQRLMALSRAQAILSRVSGNHVDFDELMKAEFAAMTAGKPNDRVSFCGQPNVRLPYASVQTLSLAIHELATNALKHGALASPDGKLRVSWQVQREPDGAWLVVDWRETGCRLPEQPRRKGFGLELIQQALPYQLGARTSYRFTDEGVHCVLSVPTSEVDLPCPAASA